MSTFQTLSVAERVAKQQADAAASAAQSQQNYNNEQTKYFQNQQDYISGKRNPVADLIKKPERDAAKEERLKQVAKWSFIKDAVGLIGKGYAASKGVMPTPTNGEGTYKALNELNKLDDIYREDGYRYDHNMMLDALRRQGAANELDKTKLGLAQNESNYNRSKSDQLDSTMLNLSVDRERRDDDRAYRDKEKVGEREWQSKQDDKNYKRNLGLVTAKSNATRDNEFRISPGNVALVVQNRRTGKMEPIADGDYYSYLNAAIKEDPEIKTSITNADNPFKGKQISDLAVSAYLERKGVKVEQQTIATEIARDFKDNDYTGTSIANLRLSPVGPALRNMSDEEIIAEFQKQGVEVVKVK